ncbi:MAG: 50S ribosomal protein L3 [Verrucomicrobia bacterium]|jgi:large subunit ribosomal protein L3|nr:MAG: 50S ribosomal protein L3 [Verrucomicrobiota bacterium]
MSIGVLGKKIGMTRVYDTKGRIRPVTVIEAGGNRILQVKTKEKDGYSAVQVGFGDQKEHRITKGLKGHFAKTSSTPKRFIREFRLKDGETAPEGGDWLVTNFQDGQFIDVISTSKGKGFQGVVRRFKFAGQPETHGSMMHRRNGAIGNRLTPGRVWKNMGMPGHMGDERITTQNLEIVQVREADGVILVSGAVPGAKGTYVMLRPSKKKSSTKASN